MDKCPGFAKDIRIKLIKCPSCGYLVEFFSDEIKRKCPKCKQEVTQEKLPSCIDWCQAAEKCLGPELFKKIRETRGENK
jgi:endogenous inhibitor of DNA gyrase (YacG/DUF329 family)